MSATEILTAAASLAAPIDGLALLRPGHAAEPHWDVTERADGLRVRIDFRSEATQEQKAAARQAVLDADLSGAGLEAAGRGASRREAKARLAAADPDTVRLRAALKLILAAVAQDRQYLAMLRGEVVRLGGTLPAAPQSRTWEQLVAAVGQAIDAGEGDAA